MAAIYDCRSNRIPNYLIMVGLIYGVCRTIALEGSSGLATALGRSLVLLLLLYGFYMIGTLGAGDVKLYALLPFYYPLSGLYIILVSAFCIAAVMAVYKAISTSGLADRILTLQAYLTQCMVRRRILPYATASVERLTISMAIPLAIVVIATVVIHLSGLMVFYEGGL